MPVGIGILVAGLLVARAADWLGHSGGVSLVSYIIGAFVQASESNVTCHLAATTPFEVTRGDD